MAARCLAGLLLAAALALGGCGASSADRAPNAAATLLLDSPPNAVHTGIYMAVERGYADALGVQLHIRVPSRSTDGVQRLVAGRADFAILDIHDLAVAREQQRRSIVGVMAIVQTPLAAILAQPWVRTPRDLQGRLVGVTGRPSDAAVLRSIVAGAGGDPRTVRTTTVGPGALASLLAGRVAGVTASWDAAGLTLPARRAHIRQFRVDDYGAPAYPELVLCVMRRTLTDQPGLVRATVAALARGYEEVLADPESGVSALVTATTGLRRTAVQRALDAVSPSFTVGARTFGELDPQRLRAWARWEQRVGLVRRRPNVDNAFDGRYVPAPGRD
jgi:ABC-type nitrate/sulfonate/bicarbonate transport system substrate-binding protein